MFPGGEVYKEYNIGPNTEPVERLVWDAMDVRRCRELQQIACDQTDMKQTNQKLCYLVKSYGPLCRMLWSLKMLIILLTFWDAIKARSSLILWC